MRPSCLKPNWATIPRYQKELLYVQDSVSNRCVSSLPPQRPPEASIRLTQYNVQLLDFKLSPSAETASDITDLLLKTDSDVIILQELALCAPITENLYPDAFALAEQLRRSGFVNQHISKDIDYPVFIASRFPLALPSPASHPLSRDAAAVHMTVQTSSGAPVDVLGAHLDYRDASKRLRQAQEMLALTRSSHPTLLVADFNQQRQADYTAEEWGWIMPFKIDVGEPASDGVDELLSRAGFRCAYDEAGAARNWPSDAPPAPTHWSGTSIDRAYARGGLRCAGVFVHPAGFSDHHAVTSDWCIAPCDAQGSAPSERPAMDHRAADGAVSPPVRMHPFVPGLSGSGNPSCAEVQPGPDAQTNSNLSYSSTIPMMQGKLL